MPFSTRVFPILIAATLAAGPAFSASLKAIKSESQFNQQVVDKKRTTGNGTWFRVKSDGTIDGMHDGKKFRGAWKWSGKYYCRNGVMGSQEIGSDCQVVKTGGGQVQFWGKKGKEEPRGTYTIN